MLDEFERLCKEREQDSEANGFHNTPAECEDRECEGCTLVDADRSIIDCPYVN